MQDPSIPLHRCPNIRKCREFHARFGSRLIDIFHFRLGNARPFVDVPDGVRLARKQPFMHSTWQYIGTFTQFAGGFTGTIKTLTLDVAAVIRRCAKDNDLSPDFRIYADLDVEFGSGWQKVPVSWRAYISCRLDDPTVAAPIYANLVPAGDDDSFVLVWSR